MLALTELHGKQLDVEQSKNWVVSAKAKTQADGRCSDPAAGVAIMLSNRMVKKIYSSGCVGSRIAWVRLHTPTGPMFFVCVYVPHKHRNRSAEYLQTSCMIV